MDGVRALAVELEEEDRHEIGGYVAMVLQKLANMNELFLGERVRSTTIEKHNYRSALQNSIWIPAWPVVVDIAQTT